MSMRFMFRRDTCLVSGSSACCVRIRSFSMSASQKQAQRAGGNRASSSFFAVLSAIRLETGVSVWLHVKFHEILPYKMTRVCIVSIREHSHWENAQEQVSGPGGTGFGVYVRWRWPWRLYMNTISTMVSSWCIPRRGQIDPNLESINKKTRKFKKEWVWLGEHWNNKARQERERQLGQVQGLAQPQCASSIAAIHSIPDHLILCTNYQPKSVFVLRF